jgi:hypothetical protein
MEKPAGSPSKRTDLLVLLLLLAVVWLYSVLTAHIWLGKPLIVAVILGLSATAYMGSRAKKPWSKLLLGTLIFGLIAGFIFEFIQEAAGGYHMVSIVLPKMFGFLPPDNIIGHTLMTLTTLTFYEHFVNAEPSQRISPRAKYALYPGLVLAVAIVVAYYVHRGWFQVPYSYAVMGSLAVIAPLGLAVLQPRYARDLSMMVPFFFLTYLIYELIAVKYSWWVYPAQYTGSVSLFDLRFPFEELLFWMLFYAAALTSYYKIYLDWPDNEQGHRS